MPLPPPPTRPVEPVLPGEISKGRKLDIMDLEAIAVGGMPFDILTAAVADNAELEVPQGVNRVIIKAIANNDPYDNAVMVQMRILRNGAVYMIRSSEQTVAGNYQNAVYADAFILKPGDQIQAYDPDGVGNVVRITILYVDVFL